MCAPLAVIAPIVGSVASIGLGIYSAYSGYQGAKAQANYQYQTQQAQAGYQFMEAQRQMDYQFQEQLRQSEYVFQNQMAARQFEYQQSNLQYENEVAEQQRRYQYEQAVYQQNYEFQQLQTDLSRGYEQMREDQQRSVMELNAELAGVAYANDLRQLDVMFMQEEEAAAQQKLKGSREAAQMRAEVRASGRVGNTVDNLVADYYRQQAQYDFATNRNLAFTGRATQEKKRGAQAQYAARKVSEQPYIQTPYANPVRGNALAPGPGVAPMYGPTPIRQQVTKGTVTQQPVYRSYVSSTPYVLQGLGSMLSSGVDLAKGIGGYNTWKAAQPGRS
jgi:hypothetical protein